VSRRTPYLALLAWAAPALLPAPARSTAPPPPPPHARYGPLVQCLGGYAVAVAPSEAIYAMQDGISLVTPAYLINLSLDDRDPYRKQSRTGEFEDPRLGRIVRYVRGSGDERRIENRLAPAEGERAVIVRSRVEEEQTALARIARASPERSECGDFIAPDFPGEDPDALWWAPTLIPGPVYRCQNGMGFAVLMGESVQSSWPMFGSEPAARLRSSNTEFNVRGPIVTLAASLQGIVAATYRRAVVDWSGRPVLLLRPPDSAPDRYGRDESYTHWIRIEFSAGAESEAHAFASRLEFVEMTDPRCQTD